MDTGAADTAVITRHECQNGADEQSHQASYEPDPERQRRSSDHHGQQIPTSSIRAEGKAKRWRQAGRNRKRLGPDGAGEQRSHKREGTKREKQRRHKRKGGVSTM